jgi:hypothetical protein
VSAAKELFLAVAHGDSGKHGRHQRRTLMAREHVLDVGDRVVLFLGL